MVTTTVILYRLSASLTPGAAAMKVVAGTPDTFGYPGRGSNIDMSLEESWLCVSTSLVDP